MHLSVYRPSTLELLFAIDLDKRISKDKLASYIYEADKQDTFGLLSAYKDPLNAELRRNDSDGRLKSGEVVRLSHDDLIKELESLKSRRLKHQRKMSKNSIANLQRGQPFTASSRPTKPRALNEDELNNAIGLRNSGKSWKEIGRLIGKNYQTIRSSINRETNTQKNRSLSSN